MKKVKVKTRKAAAKRFKITGTGKLLHRGHGSRHLKSNKSNKQLRRLKMHTEIIGAFQKKLKKMLAI